ncbi:MAG: hypothetical protein VZT48_02455 [Bulleidia sp.]|nr:hypothetical protein [Bulleidia sp.]
MTDKSKDKTQSFLLACRFYKGNKKKKKELEKKYPFFKDMEPDHDNLTMKLSTRFEPGDDVLYQLCRRNTDYVEETLARIEKDYGKYYSQILTMLYIDQKTQDAVAQENNLSRRQLMYMINKLLKEAL